MVTLFPDRCFVKMNGVNSLDVKATWMVVVIVIWIMNRCAKMYLTQRGRLLMGDGGPGDSVPSEVDSSRSRLDHRVPHSRRVIAIGGLPGLGWGESLARIEVEQSMTSLLVPPCTPGVVGDRFV